MRLETNDAAQIADAYLAAKSDAFREALANGSPLETASRAADEAGERVLAPRRGGARPGAGRKPTGRTTTAAINFKVSAEFKAEFERRARAAGLTGVAYLKRLVEEDASRGARLGRSFASGTVSHQRISKGCSNTFAI